MNKAIVVFSGYNQRAVFAFLRTIACYPAIKCFVFAKSEGDTIFDSSYSNMVIAKRLKKELDRQDILRCVNKIKDSFNFEELIVAPTTEALNRHFLEFREFYKNNNVSIPLVDKTLYAKISDKYEFGLICSDNGINVPDEYTDFYKISPPFVAKPYKYFSNKNEIYAPVLVLNDSMKEDFIKSYPIEEFYYQKFIEGSSYYLLYYFSPRGNTYKYSQLNIAQQPGGKSIVAAESSEIHNHEISKKFENMLKKLKFYGLIMIEIRKSSDDVYHMIEANPRFWGPSQLFVDAGINFFEFLLHDLDLIAMPKIQKPSNAKYFWFGGIIETIKNGKQLVYHSNETIDPEYPDKEWLECDIYNRPDTINIYKRETKL